jgi:hypothetical protein
VNVSLRRRSDRRYFVGDGYHATTIDTYISPQQPPRSPAFRRRPPGGRLRRTIDQPVEQAAAGDSGERIVDDGDRLPSRGRREAGEALP